MHMEAVRALVEEAVTIRRGSQIRLGIQEAGPGMLAPLRPDISADEEPSRSPHTAMWPGVHP